MINNEYKIKRIHNTNVCSYLQSEEERHSVGSHHNMIVVDKKEKAMINNEYKLKKYIILMFVHTYSLKKRDTV